MRRVAVLLAGTILATLTLLAPPLSAGAACAVSAAHRAAVVVEHGDGSVVQRCVGFDGSSIAGVDLLNGSGLRWSGQVFAGFGVAVCAIDGEPAAYSSCPGQDRYWALFVARAGESWRLSALGISSLGLANGDAVGFRYVPSSGGMAAAPPAPLPCPAAATPVPTVPAGGDISSPPATEPPKPTGKASATLPPTAAPSAEASGRDRITPSAGPSAGSTGQTAASPSSSPGLPGVDRPSTAGSGGGPNPGLVAGLAAIAVLGALALFRLGAWRRAPW